MLNADQVGGIIRALLAAAGGWAIGKRYVDSATATTITGALVTVAIAGWSYYTNKPGTVIPSTPPLVPPKGQAGSERT